MIKLNYIPINTEGKNEIFDLTNEIKNIVINADIHNGNVLVFVPGSTGALSTIEYEPGLIKDFPKFMEKIIPQKDYYFHNETWGDGNGHSHLKATLIGPSLTIPFENKSLLLGTWQQVIFIEFDNKPHRRKIIVQISGE